MVVAGVARGKRGPTEQMVTLVPPVPPCRGPGLRSSGVRTRPALATRGLLLLAAAALLVVLDVARAEPAAADGAGPTNFESVIDSVEPDGAPVRVEVVGGDSFLQVTALDGAEVEIEGYDREPYLRIAADGTVTRNERSAATYINQSRDGTGVELPDDVGSDGEPRWVHVGSDATVAWHDHRIHWMVDTEPAVGPDGVVQDWVVPLTVDGDEVVVSGRLLRHSDDLPWAALLGAGFGVTALLLARRHALRVPLLVGAGAVALGLSLASYAANPPDAGASLVPVVLPAAALALALLSYVAPPALRQLALPLAAVAALVGWGIARIGVLWMPIVPSEAPGWIERAGTGAVLGVAIGVAAAVLLRPLPSASSRTSPLRSGGQISG